MIISLIYHFGVSTLDVSFSTTGKPYANARQFSSAAGNWGEVQKNLENDLEKVGARAHFNGLQRKN